MKGQFKEYEPEVLKRLQRVQTEILAEFIRICEKYDLEYIMLGGTASVWCGIRGLFPGTMILMWRCQGRTMTGS